MPFSYNINLYTITPNPTHWANDKHVPYQITYSCYLATPYPVIILCYTDGPYHYAMQYVANVLIIQDAMQFVLSCDRCKMQCVLMKSVGNANSLFATRADVSIFLK